jgi:hypothetical protein
MYRTVSPRTTDVLRMVRRSVSAFFEDENSLRLPVSLRGCRVVEASGESEERCTVELGTEAGVTLRVTFRVKHVGGNVYDVLGRPDGGTTQTFTCCLPDRVEIPVAPRLGRTIGRYLVNEVRGRIGVSPGRDESIDREAQSPTSGRRAEESPSPPPSARATRRHRSAESPGPDSS